MKLYDEKSYAYKTLPNHIPETKGTNKAKITIRIVSRVSILPYFLYVCNRQRQLPPLLSSRKSTTQSSICRYVGRKNYSFVPELIAETNSPTLATLYRLDVCE